MVTPQFKFRVRLSYLKSATKGELKKKLYLNNSLFRTEIRRPLLSVRLRLTGLRAN